MNSVIYAILYVTCSIVLLYTNIDLKLRNKSHETMHYRIGVKCVHNGLLYSVVITRQSNPHISQFNSPCNEFTSVWSMFLYSTMLTK